MLQNYLRIGFRNLAKNKLFSAINISGMAISITSFLIITLYIYDELKFDKHVKDVSLKYRIFNEHFSDDGRTFAGAMVPPMFGPTLKAEYPEVEAFSRFMNFNSPVLFEVGNKKYAEGNGGYADNSILKMFSLHLHEGDLRNALNEPNTIAISQTLAKKYFGNKTALGEMIEIFNKNFKVNAVFEDFSAHSHLQLNYFISMENLNKEASKRMQSWGWSQFHTYIKLKSGTDGVQLEGKLKDFAVRNGWPVTKSNGSFYIPRLMPLEKVHLYASEQVWDIAVRGNVQTVFILFATSIFILIISILNFVNLSTARAISRVKEVGVRKVVGAFRKQLIYQFISESVILAFIALLIGGLLVELLLPGLNMFTGKSIPTGIFLNPSLVIALLIFGFFIGIAAGAYPAFYVSGFQAAHILSNKRSGRSGKTLFRQGLVVVQFILSFFLIIASFIITDQHRFMRTKDMGFDKDNVVIIQLRGDMNTDLETTKNTFSDHPNIISASLQYGLPGEAYAGDGIRDKVTKKDWSLSMLIVDHDYVNTLGIKLIAGRDFSKDFPTDQQHAFIINETAAKMLGHRTPEDALGHGVEWNRWDAPDSLKEGNIIGVVKDFHLNGLQDNISPVILNIFPEYSSMSLRIKEENIPATIAHLESTWKKFNSEWPFEYRFLDDNFDKLYKGEEKLATLFTFFTGFTIFVACLGLFGLVVYSTTQKYKEISIRKVMGAADSSLVFGLSKIYLALMGVAFVIAIPISYYAANEWLQKFAYHIDITPLLFVKAALLIIVISLLTVGIQSLKAARTNPVNALKEQ